MDKPARQLVVDASVALAADSESDTDASATASRQFLQTMRTTSHLAVMTEALEAEWRLLDKPDRPSAWAVPWLTWMRRKSRVHDADAAIKDLPLACAALADQLTKCAGATGGAQAMLEDLHLVEAALATHHTIVSRDEEVREYFSSVSTKVEALRELYWVNPCRSVEDPLTWLHHGAPAEPTRKLTFSRR